MSTGEEYDINDFIKIHEELTHERDKLLNDIKQLHRDLNESTRKEDNSKKQIIENNEQIIKLQEKITRINNENIRETKKREQIELELKTNKQNFELKNAEFKTQIIQFESQQQELKKSQQHVRQLKEENIRLTKDNQILQVRLDDARTQYSELVTINDKNTNDCQHHKQELKEKDDEIIQLNKQYENEQKKKENIEKRFKLLEEQINENKQQYEQINLEKSSLERDIIQFKKIQNNSKKQIDILTREREQLNITLQKFMSDNQKQIEQVKSFNHSKKILEQDINNSKEEANKQRKIILKMEQERDHYITEASQLTNQVFTLMEEIQRKELELFDQKKRMGELEIRLKQQQDLYEAVRYDRNLNSKHLIESQDEINEMQRKLKIMFHQIDQLKEEVQGKEQDLSHAQNDYKKVEKDKEQLILNIELLKKEAAKKEDIYTNQQTECEHLNKQLSEVNDKRQKQMKQLQQIIAERNILGTQLVRRNDELALLYEKLKIQQLTLSKGELQYKSCLEDLRILKLELKKLHHEKLILQNKILSTDELKCEISHVQRELVRERTHCRALEEELENPMNIHRWRKLEGNDPSTFELIQKIQFLQKRLIHKTQEVVQKELLIQEKEKFHIELKRILARQPGPEVVEQLSIYQEALKTKTKQLKSLISEANMYENQIDNYKYEINKLNQQFTDIQKKYFIQKKKFVRKEKEHLDEIQQLTSINNDNTLKQSSSDIIQLKRINHQTSFTGGGFNFKSMSKSSVLTV